MFSMELPRELPTTTGGNWGVGNGLPALGGTSIRCTHPGRLAGAGGGRGGCCTRAASWISGCGDGSGCTDGAAAVAVMVSVATPAMRTERVEIFMAFLPNYRPDLVETYAAIDLGVGK
jgi:hypothetical protein